MFILYFYQRNDKIEIMGGGILGTWWNCSEDFDPNKTVMKRLIESISS